ncbi:MAG TPA: PAS domain S-box protein, partial [Acidimicrobiia bacterium]|nr:PAS domain S-box protein [Acidimicrobiia bacterium]
DVASIDGHALYPANVRPRLYEEVGPALRRDGIWRGELTITDAAGGELPLSVVSVARRAADGSIEHVATLGRDIREVKRAETQLRRGEERLEALLQNSTDFVLVWDGDGDITYVTPSVRRFLGAALEAHVPGEALNITHEDDRARVDAVLARVRATPGAEEAMRFRGRRADGEYRWLETVVSNLTDDPAVRGVVLNARDVTAQVAADRALHESHEALRRSNSTMTAILENAPIAIYAIDRDCNVILWNRACETLFGISAADALGRYLPMINEDERELFDDLCAQVAEGHVFTSIESRTVRPDGKPIEISFSAAPMVGPNGAITGMLLLCADVSDRKETERALRANEGMFRGVVQHASDLILIVGRDALIRYASPAAATVFGYSPEESVGLDPLSFVHPDDYDRVAVEFAESLSESGARMPSEFRVLRADGSWRTVQSVGHNLMDDPAVEALIVTARDITDQRESELALRRSEERFRALVQNLSEMITVIGPGGNVVYRSPSAVEFFGERSLDLDDRAGVIHPDDEPCVADDFREHMSSPTAERQPMRFRVRRADGEWRHVESVVLDLTDDPAVGGLVVTTRDVTEQREAQERIAESEERYRAIVEDQTEFIARVDHRGRFTFVNEAYARYMGYTPQELLGTRLADALGTDGAARASEQVREISDSGGTLSTERQVTMADGETRWQSWTTRAIADEAGQVVEFQSIGRDVTERKNAEARLAAQAKILELVAQGRPLPQTLEAVARAVESGLGGARCSIALLDESARRLHCIAAPSMPEGFVATVERIDVSDDIASGLVGMGDLVIVEDVLADETGWGDRYGAAARAMAFRGVWSTPIRSASGASVLGALTVYFDVPRTPAADDRQLVDQMVHLTAIAIERKEFESQLAHQAHHDPLTGLPNRVLFLEFLNVALARSRRRNTTVGVLFLDLDRFKYVNDSFGHDAGDELLTSLARRLRSVVRPGDTIARFGGDEFVVLCEDLAPGFAREQAVDVAERLIDAIQQPFSRQGESQFLSTSIGIALSTSGDDRAEALLRDADAAMYRAKERGKGRWELFDEAMRATAMRRVETENALHGAVERNEFRVFYQPVMSLRDGTCVGAEALVRWQHPERGLVSPAEFITLAEETGLIVPIGRWVLEEACRQTALWRATHDDGPFTVSVNLSARQLARAELVGEVAAALEESGVAPECISLEITESVLMEDVEASLGAIKALRALGVRLGIDDFGTGYSSLGYLKRLPVDTVKVDQSFVDGLGTDAEDSAIVAAVVNLGHTLSLNVVAEGVETEEQLAELVALGCDNAQGFLFAPALPPAEFEALLEPGALWRPTRASLPGAAHAERRAG